ncbi:hypothetical protein F9K80_22560 [Brucella intermedia]|nr:hypothetical protein F9K80_22560 [Brucella intermedia]
MRADCDACGPDIVASVWGGSLGAAKRTEDEIGIENLGTWAISNGGVVTLSFSDRKGPWLVDIQAKQAAIFHASKASRRW